MLHDFDWGLFILLPTDTGEHVILDMPAQACGNIPDVLSNRLPS